MPPFLRDERYMVDTFSNHESVFKGRWGLAVGSNRLGKRLADGENDRCGKLLKHRES